MLKVLDPNSRTSNFLPKSSLFLQTVPWVHIHSSRMSFIVNSLVNNASLFGVFKGDPKYPDFSSMFNSTEYSSQ